VAEKNWKIVQMNASLCKPFCFCMNAPGTITSSSIVLMGLV